MKFGRRNRTTAAFALVLAIGAASTAGAQQAPAGEQGRGGGQAPAGAQAGGRGGNPIVEKFRREGDAIFYDLTLEDEEVLAEPLVFPTRILRRSTGANAGLITERGNCETTFETEAAASQIRH